MTNMAERFEYKIEKRQVQGKANNRLYSKTSSRGHAPFGQL